MYYISSKMDERYGVTDTRDMCEEFYTFSQIKDLVEVRGVKIYGVCIYRGCMECTAITLGKKVHRFSLLRAIHNWGTVQTPWGRAVVERHIVSSQIGTKIILEYKNNVSYNMIILTKTDYDAWQVVDRDDVGDIQVCDSGFIVTCLEVACLNSKLVSLKIKEEGAVSRRDKMKIVAGLWASKNGVETYRVWGNYLFYREFVPAYRGYRSYTLQHKIDLLTGEELSVRKIGLLLGRVW